MAAFQFPFQRILDVKENEKSQAQLDMAESLKAQVDIERSMRDLEKAVLSTRQRLEERQQEGVSIIDLLKEEEHISYLEGQLKQKRNQLIQVEHQVSEQQDTLASKVREEKTWQSIKETRKEEFYHDMKMIEQNELDDLNTVRAYMLARNG
ncbi:flagellar export protein FliJ [Guptibacillus hwajinpoensis]|uniref:flagellar export protein FliJ n=1 Tax=Guptibacillus hwajinpoensis TaxID=208199 RepID=UPI001CFEDD7C|nr:flagellar export protein FliJ [Pseudalkalibacillus hwajinpoensis]WLR61838.1 flagellar export protein FliJ [Pseudalkalibacillus hwajinpoensis]